MSDSMRPGCDCRERVEVVEDDKYGCKKYRVECPKCGLCSRWVYDQEDRNPEWTKTWRALTHFDAAVKALKSIKAFESSIEKDHLAAPGMSADPAGLVASMVDEADEALKVIEEPQEYGHEWEETPGDSMLYEMSEGKREEVRCKKCGMSGERENETGEVYWPAT